MSKEEIKFVVIFENSKKMVPCANYNFVKIFEKIKEKFHTLSDFPKIFNTRWRCEDNDRPGSPNTTVNKFSNILTVMEETPGSEG